MQKRLSARWLKRKQTGRRCRRLIDWCYTCVGRQDPCGSSVCHRNYCNEEPKGKWHLNQRATNIQKIKDLNNNEAKFGNCYRRKHSLRIKQC